MIYSKVKSSQMRKQLKTVLRGNHARLERSFELTLLKDKSFVKVNRQKEEFDDFY